MNILKCPVCGLPLTKNKQSYQCIHQHSYDISKKGYTNLLLANQGHRLIEGDKKDMVEARTMFLDGKFYSCLLQALCDSIHDLIAQQKEIFFGDIACGEGYYTTAIHQNFSKEISFHTLGIDISKAAVNHACTRKNILKLDQLDYFIGNLDYLPFLDNSFDILLNCFAPINENEFNRVCKTNGYYIRVLPGTYHLYELKDFLYPEVHLNEPKEDTMKGFKLVKEKEVNDVVELDNIQIQNVFTMTPYYYKTSLEAKERLKKLDYLKTRISFIIKIYQKIY